MPDPVSQEGVLTGLRIAVGAGQDESYTIQDMLESIAREEGFRLVPRGAYVPTEGEQIYPAVIEAMRHVGAVAKLGEYKESRDGPVQYRFRGVDAVVNAAGPAFRKAGVIPVPTILTAERTPGQTKNGGSKLTTVIRVRYTFFAADGSSIPLEVEGEANDTSDKGTGKAFSVAYRIALLQLLAIPTDDPDPDATRIEGDHTPPVSQALRSYLHAGVDSHPLGALRDLFELLTAHVAPDARVVPDDPASMVWWELWAKRYRREVEGRVTPEELKALWKEIGAFGANFRIGQGETVGSLITGAVDVWTDRNLNARREVVEAIDGATEEQQLDTLAEVIKGDLKHKTLLPEDAVTLLGRLGSRRTVLQAREAEIEKNLSTWHDENRDGETDATQAEMNEEQLG